MPIFSVDKVRQLKDVSREYILAALEFNHGNQRQTAEQLGIGSATLYRKLKSYGAIPSTRPPPAPNGSSVDPSAD
jgi:DNA-binding NtrC family response regulator